MAEFTLLKWYNSQFLLFRNVKFCLRGNSYIHDKLENNLEAIYEIHRASACMCHSEQFRTWQKSLWASVSSGTFHGKGRSCKCLRYLGLLSAETGTEAKANLGLRVEHRREATGWTPYYWKSQMGSVHPGSLCQVEGFEFVSICKKKPL